MSNASRYADVAGATGSGLSRRALMLLLALGLVASACGGSSTRKSPGGTMMVPQNAAAATPNAAGTSPSSEPIVDASTYRLAPGDLIDVKFPYHPEENERVPVRPDGRIGLQVTGDTVAAGLTVKELEDDVVKKSSVTLRDPVVSIVLAQLAVHKVYVGGQVSKPGFVLYREGMTPLQAIVERGGFTDDAKMDDILYLSRVGEQVQSQKLDLEAVMHGDATEQVVMSPDDVIFVPRTVIGDADVFVDQWVRGLLPTIPRPGIGLNSIYGF